MDRRGGTSRVLTQEVAEGFGVLVATLDAGDKVAAITLQEKGVFAPVVVFVRDRYLFLQHLVVTPVRIQNRAISGSVE